MNTANTTSLVLLPGIDGTGTLFSPLLHTLPENIIPTLLSYPVSGPQDYIHLASYLGPLLPSQPFMLVAESFGGPLALLLAEKYPEKVLGIVLSATFVRNPRRRLTFLLPKSIVRQLLRIRPPKWLIRYLLLHCTTNPELENAVLSITNSLNPETLFQRLIAVTEVDVSLELRRCSVPVLYLCAGNDRIVPTSASKEFIELSENIKHITLDSSHLLLQTKPVEATQAILEFTNKLDNSSNSRP